MLNMAPGRRREKRKSAERYNKKQKKETDGLSGERKLINRKPEEGK